MAAANELNRIGDAISASVSRWFAKDGGTPEKKKTASGAAGSAEKRLHSPNGNPFIAQQSTWLGAALTDSLGAFGAHECAARRGFLILPSLGQLASAARTLHSQLAPDLSCVGRQFTDKAEKLGCSGRGHDERRQ